MKIVHIQTTMQTILGKLDENGDVIEKIPLSIEVPKLTLEAFEQALKQLIEAREKLGALRQENELITTT